MYTHDWDGCLPGNCFSGGADWLGPNNPGGLSRTPENGTLFRYIGEQSKVYFCPAHNFTGDESFSTGIRKYSFTSPAVLLGASITKLRSCLIETRPVSSSGNWHRADLAVLPPVLIEENSEFYLETVRDSGWSNDDGITDRHRGKGQMGIADGHVEVVKVTQRNPSPASLVRMTAHNLFYILSNGKRVSAKWFGYSGWNHIETLPAEP
jgi:hypothetical protein